MPPIFFENFRGLYVLMQWTVGSSCWGSVPFPSRKVLAMTTSFDRHFAEEIWEQYAMRQRSEEDCQPLEEHLLICSRCQQLLAAADTYIQVAKAAAVLVVRQEAGGKRSPVIHTRRRSPKRLVAAN